MRHLRRNVTATVVGSLLALAALPTVALADPPDEGGVVVRSTASGGVWYADPDDRLILTTGATAAEFCTGTMTGDPLQQQFVETPTGAILLLVSSSEAEAWLYAATTIDEACDLVLSGGSPELLATGTVRFRINDNDLFASQTRTNSFGDHASGTLTALDGSSWNVTAHFRAVVLPSADGTCHCVMVRSDIIVAATGR
jgi:hypothetical protein